MRNKCTFDEFRRLLQGLARKTPGYTKRTPKTPEGEQQTELLQEAYTLLQRKEARKDSGFREWAQNQKTRRKIFDIGDQEQSVIEYVYALVKMLARDQEVITKSGGGFALHPIAKEYLTLKQRADGIEQAAHALYRDMGFHRKALTALYFQIIGEASKRKNKKGVPILSYFLRQQAFPLVPQEDRIRDILSHVLRHISSELANCEKALDALHRSTKKIQYLQRQPLFTRQPDTFQYVIFSLTQLFKPLAGSAHTARQHVAAILFETSLIPTNEVSSLDAEQHRLRRRQDNLRNWIRSQLRI